MAFQAKSDVVLARQNKVQKLSIPFTITANATAANKTMTIDEPALLFLKLEGINNIATSTGALETGEVLPSLATATDSTGVFNVCVKVGEAISKVLSVKWISRGASGASIKNCEVLALTTVSTNCGQSVIANVTSGVNLGTTNMDAVIEVEYITTK